MKRILLSAFALILTVFAYSQTIIENPKVGMSTASNVKIEKIELNDTATIMWFHVNNTPGNWISIPKGTYIQPVGAKDKLFVVSSEGIPLNEKYTMPASGQVDYKLAFPKIDASTRKLDYGEANDGGTWFIYDIQIKPEMFKSVVPEKITGNWFRTDNAQWEISLFDSVAIYKSQVWKYQQYSEKDGKGKIGLKNGKKMLNLYLQLVDDKTCMLGESPDRLIKYSLQPEKSVIPADNEPFKLPVFKADTAVYCGYIKGFSRRFQQRTGMVYVNDVLVGTQLSYLLKIADDGTFQVKIPHTNPQGIFVRLPFSFETIFVEPGKTTFHLIDNGNKNNPILFMGESARVNSDLAKLKFINSYSYNQMIDKVLDFSPEQYKAWCQELQKKDLNSLKQYAQTNPLSAKAEQIKQLEINYRYSSIICEYSWNIDAAWRKKNNIPQNQREIDFKPAKPDSTFYNFMTNDLVNNPMAVVTSEYYTFINRLMFLEILRRSTYKQFTFPEIVAEMDKANYKIPKEERDVIIQLQNIETPELKKVQTEFQKKYGEQSKNFNQKYSKHLQEFYKEKKGTNVTYSMIEEYLLGKKVEFSEDEKELIEAQKVFNENPLIEKRNLFYAEYNKAINQFYNDHRVFINALYKKIHESDRKEKLQKMLGIQPGFATDIMASQEYCRPIVTEMTPCTDEKLREFQREITTPFISEYIVLKNKETIARIEANKTQKGANVNEVPKTEGDKVFDAIMAKYKGKVVYVDFWATWCAPCRSGIEMIKPLKEEMANEKVAFVYITSPSSPKGTYDNMIPTIKGEHYYVSADEWNILCGKFNISGIPHYVLVGKDGKVINPHLNHMDNGQLKALLMKHIKE